MRPATSAQDRRNARWYLTGLGLSLIGDTALSLVAGIWARQLTGSSAVAGAVMTCIYLPSLLGPVAGLVVDRVPRQRFIVVVNLCTAAAVASLLFLSNASEVWLLFAVMTCYGTSLVLIDPAETALFAHMFPDTLRDRINGWRLGMQETGRLVAPLVGAGLFAAMGGAAVAGLDAVSFLIAALATSRLRPLSKPLPLDPLPSDPLAPNRQSWRRELTAGFEHIRATPGLSRIVFAAALIMAVSGLGVAAQFSMVAALHQPPAYLGVFSALLGAGSVVASLTSSRVIARWGVDRLVSFGLIAFAIGTCLRAVPTLVSTWAGSLVLGFALPWVFLACLTAAQTLTPAHLQGRVAAAVSLSLFGPQAPTQAIGSLLITHVPYEAVYLGSATAAAMVTVATLRSRPNPSPWS